MQIIPSSLLLLSALFILPESPRFLVRTGKVDQARKVLSYVRHLAPDHSYINTEIEDISFAIEREERPSARSSEGRFALWRELWWKGNRVRICIGLGLMFGQNLTGINGVNFYTPTIFKSIGFDGTKVGLLASGLSSAVSLPPDLGNSG
jgi:MFS family permease